jgi:hypothetical protein
MGLAEIFAFFKALPMIANALNEVVMALKQMKQDSINKELDIIKADVGATLKKIEGAKSAEERKVLALELALRMQR